MASAKEVNFFLGPPESSRSMSWEAGNWHRGTGWYCRQFDPEAAVVGESSPGYTSPDHAYAAGRIARVVPDAMLVYLVRDPIDRAVSQYDLHRRDGSESRPIEQALPDPDSQYLARGRYLERLEPFLEHFRRDRIIVLEHEELRRDPLRVLRGLGAALGLDARAWPAPAEPPAIPDYRSRLDGGLVQHLEKQLRDDARRFQSFSGLDLISWGLA